MGSMDDYPRKPLQQQNSRRAKLKFLLLLVATNLLSIFLFSGSGVGVKMWGYTPSIYLSNSNMLLRELNATQNKLSASQELSAELYKRLGVANSLLETIIAEMGQEKAKDNVESSDGWQRDLDGELKLAVGPHKLPLGYTPNLGTDEMYPVLGSECRRFQDELIQYMSYQAGGECPSDDVFAQRLMLKGCEPLPRRRCHPKSPAGYVEPTPFPESMWTIPPDTSIVWDPYTCKNYSCLVNRNKAKGSYDCKDCFDLSSREKKRWLYEFGEIDYSIDQVLASKPPGTVRIGLDIGGGTATFAARMRERNITIVTTSMNFDGPFNSFIASRGLIPMHISVAHRLPFFDNTLDIVHSMHVLSNWIPDTVLEFALYDIYRVLRPGGLFWLDHFFCVGSQMNSTYVPMFNRIGFNKLRWNAGRKLDRGIEKDEWYLSALLEKPMS
ncbi:probable methyltransferase At1g29790 [Typha latifolia]|uniref:probable methyltransferase At1g29790 n=1 Tax=Typha latifolia TaxID=4733 RepID=UPI003C2D27A8